MLPDKGVAVDTVSMIRPDGIDALDARLIALFTKGEDGRRPSDGERTPIPPLPGGEEALLFHEFFDGDTGRGLVASHQTGWTALILNLLHSRARRAQS